MTSSGERKPPVKEGGTWHRRERGYGRFSRLLTLPCEVKTDEVEAQFKDGVLTITLPKSEAAKPPSPGDQGRIVGLRRGVGNVIFTNEYMDLKSKKENKLWHKN